jgi:nucleoside triphosphate pyrophosphatase
VSSVADADLVLASASPRRRELLERIGLVLQVTPVDLDETPRPGESARPYAQRLAAEKCAAAAAQLGDEVPVLAADTVVVLEGAIFGKPGDDAEAAAMLGRLSGRRHEVITAYHIRHRGAAVERAVTTAVTFRLLSPAEVDAYVASGEWRGKAGGYAVQGIAALFTTELRGSLTNVIGLPLAEVVADLRAAGALGRYPPPAFAAAGAPPPDGGEAP